MYCPDFHTAYDRADAAALVDSWYSVDKERAFVEYLLERCGGLSGVVVEFGGGTGVHGALLRARVRGAFLHTDFAESMCVLARAKGVASRRMDALEADLADESVDAVIAIGLTTLLMDGTTRERQLHEFDRILRPRGKSVIVSPDWGRPRRRTTVERQQAVSLTRLGYSVLDESSWGVIPGSIWGARRRAVFARVEERVARLGLGARRVLVLRKP